MGKKVHVAERAVSAYAWLKGLKGYTFFPFFPAPLFMTLER